MLVKEREARQQVLELRNEARAILDKAEAEERDLTPEEESRAKELVKKAEELSDRITRGEFKENDAMPVVLRANAEPDVMAEFRNYLRGRAFESRVLKSSVDAAGGVMAPEGFVAEVIKRLEEVSVMRRVARVITIGEKSTRIPRLVKGVTAAWTDEADPIDASDAEFDQVELTPHKLGVLTQVSNELLADAALNVETFLAELFAEELAAVEDAAFFGGDGDGKPTGILHGDEIEAVDATGADVEVEDIFALYDALEPQYRPSAVWIMHPSTLGAIRRLQDGSGRYLLVDSGLAEGAPNTILGRPVYLSTNMPVIDEGNKSILFGDMRRSYYIADRVGLDVQRSSDRYFELDVTAFRAIKRTDGKIALPDAARVLVHPA